MSTTSDSAPFLSEEEYAAQLAEKKAAHAAHVAAMETRFAATRKRNRWIGLALLVLLIGGVVALIARPGEPPATQFDESGTYTVGDDIAAGTWTMIAPGGGASPSNPCTWSVRSEMTDTVRLASPSWAEQYAAMNRADRPLTQMATAGVRLRDGDELMVTRCGTWTKTGEN